MINIDNNVLLKDHTTFKIGGPADYYVEVRSRDELKEALDWAKKNNHRYFILGGGSNLIFLDEGFRGLVIKPQIKQLEVSDHEVIVGASVILADLIQETLAKGLVGMEFAAGIPGTVGGGIRGNAGTFGVDFSAVLTEIRYLDETTLEEGSMHPNDGDFRYRHSIFKSHNYIITGATLKLEPGDVEASKRIIEERIATRRERHPLEPSAGCIFKNVQFKDVDLTSVEKKGVEVEKFKQYQKIPAGYLIEKLGLKGKNIGDAQVSPKHGNYIVNNNQATADQVIQLISLLKQQVRDKFGIQLEEEVHIVYNDHS